MNSKQSSTGFGVQVLTGGLAAVTAALLGSTLGVAGTVLGAGIASVVTTIAAAAYARSIQRTRDGVQRVRARATGTHPEPPEESSTQPEPTRHTRWPILVTAGVLAFVLGMLAITGVEALTGSRISGGQGTTIGGIVRPNSRPNPVTPTSTTTPGTTSSSPSVTSTPPTTTGTAQPTTTPPQTSTSTSEPAPTSGTTTTSQPSPPDRTLP
jgi:hypothetical protein